MCRHTSQHGIVWIQGHYPNGMMMQKLEFSCTGACTVSQHTVPINILWPYYSNWPLNYIISHLQIVTKERNGFGHIGRNKINKTTLISWTRTTSLDSLIKNSRHNSPLNILIRTNGLKYLRIVVPSKQCICHLLNSSIIYTVVFFLSTPIRQICCVNQQTSWWVCTLAIEIFIRLEFDGRWTAPWSGRWTSGCNSCKFNA